MHAVSYGPQDPDATCADHGHEWEYAFQHPSDDEPESRECIHCGRFEWMEDSGEWSKAI